MRTNSAERLQAAQSKVEAQLGLVLEGLDEYTGSLLSDVEAVTRRGRRQGGQASGAARPGAARVVGSVAQGKKGRRGAVTPPSNRGVRSVDNSNRKGKPR